MTSQENRIKISEVRWIEMFGKQQDGLSKSSGPSGQVHTARALDNKQERMSLRSSEIGTNFQRSAAPIYDPSTSFPTPTESAHAPHPPNLVIAEFPTPLQTPPENVLSHQRYCAAVSSYGQYSRWRVLCGRCCSSPGFNAQAYLFAVSDDVDRLTLSTQ